MQFNQNQWNTGLYGIDGTIAPAYSTDLAVFDGFSLSDGIYMGCKNIIDSAAEREVNVGNIPRGNGMYVNGDYWRKKPIEVSGIVKASSKTALNAYLDTIKKNLRKRGRFLDVTRTDDSGTIDSVRRYIATWMNPEEIFADRQPYHVTYCPFLIRFDCHYPFGRDRNDTSTSLTITSSPTTQAIYHSGTIDADPKITLIFDSASSVTVVNVKRVDPDGNTLDEIEYSGAVAANDVLVFNSEYDQKTVTKNGAAVAYTGGFLSLEPGSNLIKFTITGSSFNAIATIAHKSTYL